MESQIAEFVSITGSTPEKAASYLKLADGDPNQAIELFFAMDGVDVEQSTPVASASNVAPALPPRQSGSGHDPIEVDDDVEDMEDDDVREAVNASSGSAPHPAGDAYEDDEAMARRLQEEAYRESGGGGEVGSDGVRAPIAKTRETLVGGYDDDDVMEDWEDRISHHGGPRGAASSSRRGAAGIFNQARPSVWEEGASDDLRRRQLAAVTGGASEASSKSHTLAEMYRPPYEILNYLSFDDARDEAKEAEKWILVNVQDQSVFDSQILNRDIWKAQEVQATIKENFLFLQMEKDGRDGRDYIRLYIPQAANPAGSVAGSFGTDNLFPHIAIIDPRTGEQVKVWHEMPKSAMEFVQQLYDFLERYSLKLEAKNPVQRKPMPQQKDVSSMSEEEQLQMAMQQSLGASAPDSPARGVDPDSLTREEDLMEFEEKDMGKGKGVAEPAAQTPFQKVRSDVHHEEPAGPPGDVTRIQFKMHDGSRVVRKFRTQDTVENLFEYVKADLLPQHEAKKGDEGNKDKEFDLVCMGKKLIDILDQTVQEAGLKQATIMVETVED